MLNREIRYQVASTSCSHNVFIKIGAFHNCLVNSLILIKFDMLSSKNDVLWKNKVPGSLFSMLKPHYCQNLNAEQKVVSQLIRINCDMLISERYSNYFFAPWFLDT